MSDFFATPWTLHGLYLCPWNSPGQNTGVSCHALLQGIFPTQGSNPGLLHCRQMLYHLGHQGSQNHVSPLLRTTPAPGFQFSSVQFSHSVMSDSLRPHDLQHTRPPCPSPTPQVYPNSRPLSRWCHPTISSSVVPLSSCLQFFTASGSFQMSQLIAPSGQSIGISASASVLPMTQNWSPLEWTGWISLQSKRLALNSYYPKILNTFWTRRPSTLPFCAGSCKLGSQSAYPFPVIFKLFGFAELDVLLVGRVGMFCRLHRVICQSTVLPRAELHFPNLDLGVTFLLHNVVTMALVEVHVKRSGSSFEQ